MDWLTALLDALADAVEGLLDALPWSSRRRRNRRRGGR